MTNEEVIEVLEKEESYMLSHGGDRQAKALRIAIDKIEQEPRWIPVAERLPDKSGRYLLSYSSGYVGIAHYYKSVLKWGCPTNERIGAWMPLPQPYKAEREE